MTTISVERRPIAVLEPSVVDRIAAGEVIDTPSSVVRELVENAIDAGASLIQIEIRGGGLDLVRVADDGHGIEASELYLAFGRYSTSKLRSVADLAHLTSFGFRGEALPSIAAVADVEVASSTGHAALGRRLLVREGRLVEERDVARERGTTVWVRGLFASLPARVRFLREPRAEVAAVARRVKWCAVANPDVRFELIVDGRLHFRAAGSGRLEASLAEAQGADIRQHLARLEPQQVGPYQVEGLLTVGGLTRPSRQHLALFVNRRRVRVEALDAAVDAGYAGLLPTGRHPIGAIFVRAPAGAVDLNIHPSKEQVRLHDEPRLADGLRQMVRAMIGASPREPGHLERYALDLPSLVPRRVAEDPGLWHPDRPTPAVPRYLAQLHGALLLCEARQGLVLVDQHRAHERVLFERLKRAGGADATQALLDPAIVEVPLAHAPVLDGRLADLNALGFGYERFGQRAYRLTSAPVVPEAGDMLEFASEALAVAGERDEFWRERLLATVACRTAIKKGRPVPAMQAAALLEDLFQVAGFTTCPHGSPVVLQLSRPFLRRQFHW